VKADVANAARALLAMGYDVHDATKVAAHAATVCRELSRHVGRLVGDLGVRAMSERSLYLAGASFPCLRSTAIDKLDGPYEALRVCLEREAPAVALPAAIHVLTTFIELLERFIGEGLVASLLHEVWPAVFPGVVKETK
jgi:hypothetical protein